MLLQSSNITYLLNKKTISVNGSIIFSLAGPAERPCMNLGMILALGNRQSVLFMTFLVLKNHEEHATQ